ncbi:hypothetical protein A5819_001047 [Enterococcus sp. 7E2_DIV0204]|uniref:Uncharacterized protein n=1 Tax=Candidatus Enterococcus lemimoniae TaxID=1834167 RepID=A0ABZ2T7M3_9ENTE|nr:MULTISPECIES: hypothetical protein [unclassified Enterococcus]OTN88566.1 hypothetical protein A5819_001047 [Enterococcus sp. 7E2_DIV0204]OTO70725.1 hypothetical protein A5866_002962 [Enterococcus sp. 12C11_DIV0727]OTP51035.1 hypothetical protein A5884_000221 [Enterococcus sp. 7D2_DIV0200]
MKNLFKTVVFEMSLYYGLLALVLPLIYAVTYHVAFISVFNVEWFAVTVFIYPIVLILSAIRYSYGRMRKSSHV